MQLTDQEKLIVKILRTESDTKAAVLSLIESFERCDELRERLCGTQ